MRRTPRLPVVLAEGSPPIFPDPARAATDGLLAIGGDLSTPRLLAAYRAGIFPWYDTGYPPMWWSPDPRAVLDPAALHVSRSLEKVLRRAEFTLSWNGCFERVMRECGLRRKGGTWIVPEMIEAYARLHREGHAHSLEVFRGADLVGGVYGVQIGGLFAAESMFHRATDMSKVALVALVRSLFRAGIRLLDVQMPTGHLERMGARTLQRSEYLRLLPAACEQGVDLRRLVPSVVAGAGDGG